MGGHSEPEGRGRALLRYVLTVAGLCVGAALAGLGLIDQDEGATWAALGFAAPVSAQLYVGDAETSPQLKQWRKDLRQALRRFRRVISHSLRLWVAWAPTMLVGLVWILAVGALDRAIVARYRQQGISAAGKTFILGMAVYIRLLRDRATPAVGKALLVAVLLYAGSARDLVWDTRGMLGLIDDGVFLAIASRSFLRMCPQPRVEAHARAVIRPRRRSRVAPNADELQPRGVREGSRITGA